jgi:hypothetical protein
MEKHFITFNKGVVTEELISKVGNMAVKKSESLQ